MAPTPDTMRPREAAPAPVPVPAPANPNSALDLDTIALPNPLTARAVALPRQPQSQATQTPTIPSFYGSLDAGPSPGTIVGITLGAVGGFVVVLWFIYMCINLGNPANMDTSTVVTEGTASVYTRRSARRHHGGRRSVRGGVKETVEIRRGHPRGPVIVEEVVSSVGVPSEHIIVEERVRRSGSRHRPSMPPPPRRVVSSDSGSEDDDDDDEVVVIEEHTPPRRQRRGSGYREVDPDRFAGGNASYVEMRRSSSRRR